MSDGLTRVEGSEGGGTTTIPTPRLTPGLTPFPWKPTPTTASSLTPILTSTPSSSQTVSSRWPTWQPRITSRTLTSLLSLSSLCVILCANTGTCTTCVDNTTTKIGCKPIRGHDTASVCTIISHIYLSRGTCMMNMRRWRDDGCTNIHVDSGVRGGRVRDCVVWCMCSAVYEAFNRWNGLARLMMWWQRCTVHGEV